MREHKHEWGGTVFIAGLAVRHCTKDCTAAQAKEGPHNEGEWVRVDRRS